MYSLEKDGAFGNGPKVGRHASARTLNATSWTFNSQTLAYNTTTHYTDGTKIDFFRKERPQLFFSDDGTMTPLFLTKIRP